MMQFEAGNNQAKKNGPARGDGQRRAYAKPQLVMLGTEQTENFTGPSADAFVGDPS
jgi:hypothetical protein